MVMCISSMKSNRIDEDGGEDEDKDDDENGKMVDEHHLESRRACGSFRSQECAHIWSAYK